MGGAASIDPKYAKNITIYHVNPHQLGAKPVNMDSGDAPGDMFFDFHNVIIMPLRCPHGAQSGHGCSNPEAVAPNLVVNKVNLEIDSRFSEYARCNIGVNGTDGHGHQCKEGTYCCYCQGTSRSETVNCNNTLGHENVKEYFGRGGKGCKSGSPEWECFLSNLPKKFTDQTPGSWYSSLDQGYCGSENVDNCTWRVVSVEKVVQKSCHNKVFFGAVEKKGSACFKACGSDKTNSSSPCWVNCFYSTVLGADAGKPGGQVAGMPLQSLIDAWLSPFDSEDPAKGGCPGVPSNSFIGPAKGSIWNSPDGRSDLEILPKGHLLV